MGLSLPSHCGPNPGIYSLAVRPHREGRFASVTRRGTGGGGRCGAINVRSAFGGPSRMALARLSAHHLASTGGGVGRGQIVGWRRLGPISGGYQRSVHRGACGASLQTPRAGRRIFRQILRRVSPVCITNNRTQGCGAVGPGVPRALALAGMPAAHLRREKRAARTMIAEFFVRQLRLLPVRGERREGSHLLKRPHPEEPTAGRRLEGCMVRDVAARRPSP